MILAPFLDECVSLEVAPFQVVTLRCTLASTSYQEASRG